MSKKKKRLERMRQNKRNVSYNDFIVVLADYDYTIRSGKGSHRVATANLDEESFILTFAEPHQQKFMHYKDVERLLEQIEEMNSLKEINEDEDDTE